MNQTEAELIYLFNRYTMTEKFSNRLQVIVNRWIAKSLMQCVSVDGGTESSSKIVNLKKQTEILRIHRRYFGWICENEAKV